MHGHIASHLPGAYLLLPVWAAVAGSLINEIPGSREDGLSHVKTTVSVAAGRKFVAGWMQFGARSALTGGPDPHEGGIPPVRQELKGNQVQGRRPQDQEGEEDHQGGDGPPDGKAVQEITIPPSRPR